MNSKKWLAVFAGTVALLALLLLLGNVLIDPYGVFGDVIFHWDAYSQSMNPRVGKTEYIERHHDEYDSYILGCSSTSSFPVEELNGYTGADFYNMFTYGADMLDVENFARRLIGSYTVKNILLNVYIDNGAHYDVGEDNLTNCMHPDVTGGSKLGFYLKYLFLNPQYAIDKVMNRLNDEYFARGYDAFDLGTGAYDKRERDVEAIDSLEDYVSREAYADFADYPTYDIALTSIDSTMESVGRIKKLCEEAGVNLTVVCGPVYSDYMRGVDPQDADRFYRALAEVTPFWDFSMSSVSFEPRYFYDSTHFRNCVGVMAEARIFGDEDVWVPEDFGVYVTEENVSQLAQRNARLLASGPEERVPQERVPILMYHSFTDDPEKVTDVTALISDFRGQMEALKAAGYNAVFYSDLIDFVYRGTPLPEKPVLISVDDGYADNLELAAPILEELGLCATVSVIGVSVGKDTYKDTGYPMTPHFALEDAAPYVERGVLDIQSHSFDMHQAEIVDGEDARDGVLRKKGEGVEEYLETLTADYLKSREQISSALGLDARVFTYPNGKYDVFSEYALTESGAAATVSVRSGVSTVVAGLPQSLYALPRLAVPGGMDAAGMMELLSQ